MKRIYISEKNAQIYYNELLKNYNYDTRYLYIKVPCLKNIMENEILKEITGISHFKSPYESGQLKWLKDNIEKRNKNGDIICGFIPKQLISGNEHLFDQRNTAEHDKKMTKATYLGIFDTIAETIKFFSGIDFPKEIKDICDVNNNKPEEGELGPSRKKVQVIHVKQRKTELPKGIDNNNENNAPIPDIINEIIEKCVIIKIFKKTVKERGSVYEAVRWRWPNKRERANEADYVLAVEYESKQVIGVYKPTLWYKTTKENNSKYGGGIDYNRIAFIGDEADDEIKKKYLGKRIHGKFIDGQASFRYNNI